MIVDVENASFGPFHGNRSVLWVNLIEIGPSRTVSLEELGLAVFSLTGARSEGINEPSRRPIILTKAMRILESIRTALQAP
jgi:hypothetical protein